MDEKCNTDGLGARVDELVSFQKELKEEKVLLTKILSKIDKQINALEVEQMHLTNMIKRSTLNMSENNRQPNNITSVPSTNKMLDLSVARSMLFFKEETEDDDDDDN